MKKYYIFLVVCFSFFVNMAFLHADCEELMKDVNDVKVYKVTRIPKYDEVDWDSDDSDFLVGIAIEGLDERFYAVVTNSYNKKETIIKSEDNVDGKVEMSSPYIYEYVTMNVKLYSNDLNVCNSTDVLKSVDVETDIYNQFYYFNVCRENSDLEVCQPTYDNSKYDSADSFVVDVNKILEERNKSIFVKILEFILKYIWYIIIPIVLISIVYITRIIIVKRRMKNE